MNTSASWPDPETAELRVRRMQRKLHHWAVDETDRFGGSVTLTRQPGRHVLHLLYGPPQVRGKSIPTHGGGVRVMEMIEANELERDPLLGDSEQRHPDQARRREHHAENADLGSLG